MKTDMQTAVDTVKGWAHGRAMRSTRPMLFTNVFEGELAMVLNGAHPEEERWDTTDPVHMAAEIEAIAAGRIIKHWPIRFEMTTRRPKRGQR